MISLIQAHKHIESLAPFSPEVFSLEKSQGKVCSEDVFAQTSCPSVDSSLKDGFAVVSSDVTAASCTHQVALTVRDSLCAGDTACTGQLVSGKAVRIMTGAAIPDGATAVLASEFARDKGSLILACADAEPGRNILCKGSDIIRGQLVIHHGEILGPTHLGLLAAAGVNELKCYPGPRVAVAATGSELVWPGEQILPGKVAASNMVTAAAELRSLGIKSSTVLLRDELDKLEDYFRDLISTVDVLITCGGVLDGDKDLTLKAMEAIGMKKIFHRVRIGPGKGACMGRVGKTVVFNLPGGPPSNHVALHLLALPGIRRLMGLTEFLPVKRSVVVSEEYLGQSNWTQLIYCKLKFYKNTLCAMSLKSKGRLSRMAEANALLEIPEGCDRLYENEKAYAWLFRDVQ